MKRLLKTTDEIEAYEPTKEDYREAFLYIAGTLGNRIYVRNGAEPWQVAIYKALIAKGGNVG